MKKYEYLTITVETSNDNGLNRIADKKSWQGTYRDEEKFLKLLREYLEKE